MTSPCSVRAAADAAQAAPTTQRSEKMRSGPRVRAKGVRDDERHVAGDEASSSTAWRTPDPSPRRCRR